MKKLSIEDCGTAHEEDLRRILELIIAEKLRNGETITSAENDEIEMAITSAYQQILETLQKVGMPDAVPQALRSFVKAIEINPNGYLEVTQKAISIAVETIQEVPNKNIGYNNVPKENMHTNATEVYNIIEKSDFSKEKFIEKYSTKYDEKMYETLYSNASSGNEEAKKHIELISKATYLLAKAEHGERSKLLQAVIIVTEELRRTNDDFAINQALKLVEAYGLDVLSYGENGKQEISVEKLEKAYEENKISSDNLTFSQKVEFVQRARMETKNRHKFYEQSYTGVLGKYASVEIKRRIMEELKKTNTPERIKELEEIIKTNPEEAEEMLKSLIIVYNKNVELGKDPTKTEKFIYGLKNAMDKSIAKDKKTESKVSFFSPNTTTLAQMLSNNTLVKSGNDDDREDFDGP